MTKWREFSFLLRTFSLISSFVNVLIFLVPSVAPSGLRVSKLHLTELKVQWNPIPQPSVNGRLLGYVVNYQEYPYYRYSLRRVNTSSPDVHMLVLSGLKAAHPYRVWVAGFTGAGTGPQSSKFSVTTGKLNRSTTNLIDHRQCFCQNLPLRKSRVAIRDGPRIKKFKGQFGPFLLQGWKMNTA